jgi:ArsR family transcriptional regulator
MEEREQVKIFKALASESRLKVLRLLKEHPQCVNSIAARLKMTQPTVSQHLRLLKEAGLAKAEKRGIWMHYEFSAQSMKCQGITLAGIFEGEGKSTRATDGTLNCPPKVLKECRKAPEPKKKAG